MYHLIANCEFDCKLHLKVNAKCSVLMKFSLYAMFVSVRSSSSRESCIVQLMWVIFYLICVSHGCGGLLGPVQIKGCSEND